MRVSRGDESTENKSAEERISRLHKDSSGSETPELETRLLWVAGRREVSGRD